MRFHMDFIILKRGYTLCDANFAFWVSILLKYKYGDNKLKFLYSNLYLLYCWSNLYYLFAYPSLEDLNETVCSEIARIYILLCISD